MVLVLKERVKEIKEVRERAEDLEKDLTSAIASMDQMDVARLPRNASTSTSVKGAKSVDMEKWTAKLMRECEQLGRRPRYLRHNVF